MQISEGPHVGFKQNRSIGLWARLNGRVYLRTSENFTLQ
jgi:hypothetical protein